MLRTKMLLAILLLAGFTSCDKAREAISAVCSDAKTCFSVDSFNLELKRRLDGNCVGYGYVITAKDQVITFNNGGFERLSQDGNKKAFSVYDPMNPASLSKTISAIALMSALYYKDILPSDSIYKYLPKDWKLNDAAKTITFSQLMTHRSGIRLQYNSLDYGGLKAYIQDSVKLANKSTQHYDNANFALMRILIPVIYGYKITGTDAAQSKEYGLAFIKYANDFVFSKVGVYDILCKPNATDQSLCYQFPDNGKKGGDFGDWTNYSGGAGFNITPLQYATVMRNTFYTDKILPAGMGQTMRDSMWGFDYWQQGRTPFFNVYYVGKNGYFPGSMNPGEFNGQYYMFDNNISVVLYVNSQIIDKNGNSISIGNLVLDAFDAAR